MVIRGCNLSCEGCTTFSDLKHSGYTTWDQGRRWLQPWTERLELPAIGFMGGEPLMNPDIKSWIHGVRDLLPQSQIRFVTNGLLLHKHWDVFELLRNIKNSVFKISYHVNDSGLDLNIQKIFDSGAWIPVQEFGIDRWLDREHNFRFQIAKPDRFLRTFKNNYENMMPHNSDPRQAFECCVQQRCPLLFENKIFKCGTVGLTPQLLKRFGNPNQEQWQPYLVDGLTIDSSDQDIENFVNNFGKPHSICRQCPSQQDQYSFVDHRVTVRFKNDQPR